MKAKSLLMIGAAMSLGLASCTNEIGGLTPENPSVSKGLSIVHAPDVTAWSGSQALKAGYNGMGKSRASEGSVITSQPVVGDMYQTDWNDLYNKTNDYLEEGKTNVDNIDTDFLYYAEEDITFTLYCLMKNTNQEHYLGVFYYDEEGNMHKQLVWENINPNFWNASYTPEGTIQHVEGVSITIPAGYKFGFYWNGVCRPGEGEYTDKACEYYSIAELNEMQKDSDSDAVLNTHAGTFEINGKTILGLEDWYDFDYQDLVFFTDVTLAKVDSSDKLPDVKDNNNGDDNNGDDNGDDNNGDDNNGDDNNGDDNGDNPADDVEVPHDNEVEVNLSINDSHTENGKLKYDTADLWSKLSIHVRKGTDVRIVMPVSADYICASDDFAIIQTHLQNMGSYSGDEDADINFDGTKATMTYQIENWTVTLTVEFEMTNGEYPAGCITVTTDGITQELIDYLFEKNGDGINFEIWNYFQTEYTDENGNVIARENVDREGLQYWLNKSTIEFLDEEPDYYINAFGSVDGNKTDGDCNVSIIGSQLNDFNYAYTGEHLNDSDFNEVYVKRGVDPDTAHRHRGSVTPPKPPVPVY